MDGMRVTAIVKDGIVEFRSRNGKEINLLGNLVLDVFKLAGGANLVFDGELLVRKNGKILDRQTGNGILNRANKGTISKEQASLVEMTVWDVIPYDKFITGKYEVPYKDRFDDLYTMNELNPSPKINVVMTNIVPNLEIARSFFNLMLEEGQEGIILKDANSIWENKRSKGQVKFKAELDTSLIVTNIQLGTGKYEGLLGAIMCESADGIIKVNVGSGFTDTHRKEFIDDSLIGKIVSVKYNAKIQAKNGEWSLFLPVFEYVRTDQDLADSFDRIL
jgi:ATP-dependent DNA ligase